MKTPLRSVAVAALLMVLAGCSAQVGPPVAPPAAPGNAVVATSAVGSTQSPPGSRSLDASETAVRFDALQRFYDEEPRFRDPMGSVKAARRGTKMYSYPLPDLHYIRFTDGARTVYGFWAVGGNFSWAGAEEDEAPYYRENAYKRCASKYPAVTMTEQQRAAFLNDASAYPGPNIGAENLDTVRSGRATITTVVGAEYLGLDSGPSSELMWIWDPKSDMVFEVEFD